jgi:Flp pilus assembly protein TadG
MARLFRKSERGYATVEFALALPILLLVVFGAVEFGLAFHSQQVLTDASREGARAGIIMSTPRPSASQIQDVVRNYLSAVGWDTSKATITVTGAGGASGSDLTVRVDYPTTFTVLHKLAPGVPATITQHSTTVMKLE